MSVKEDDEQQKEVPFKISNDDDKDITLVVQCK